MSSRQSFYDLPSNLILGILTRECNFRWSRCPPFGRLFWITPHLELSDTEPTQAAKDVTASQDALIDIFDRIENFFRRLEEYTEVPTTDGMEDIMVKIMVEILGIFAIVTKEIKQGRASELIFLL